MFKDTHISKSTFDSGLEEWRGREGVGSGVEHATTKQRGPAGARTPATPSRGLGVPVPGLEVGVGQGRGGPAGQSQSTPFLVSLGFHKRLKENSATSSRMPAPQITRWLWNPTRPVVTPVSSPYSLHSTPFPSQAPLGFRLWPPSISSCELTP